MIEDEIIWHDNTKQAKELVAKANLMDIFGPKSLICSHTNRSSKMVQGMSITTKRYILRYQQKEK